MTPKQFKAIRSFSELTELFEADQVWHDRLLEFGLFVAWHVEAFSRQKTLQSLPSILSKFRASRKGKGKPVQDWRLEREQMAAIRERMSTKDKTK